MVYQRYWRDEVGDMDRQRRKQAEFLIHQSCTWNMITEIGVLNKAAQARVENIQNQFPQVLRKPVRVQPNWYY